MGDRRLVDPLGVGLLSLDGDDLEVDRACLVVVGRLGGA